METIKGKVISKEIIARDFCHLRIKVQESYDFKAGQFALLSFFINGEKETRAYSFASPPSLVRKEGILEFGIKRKQNGKVSSYVYEKLKVGEEVEISQSKGHMILDNAPTRDFVFIAAGSGITPFRSMILELAETGKYNSIVLIYGNKYREDVAYHDLFLKLSNEIKNFEYYSILSRDEREYKDFYKGHVQDILFDDNRKLISNDRTYFLCGMPAMVQDVNSKLIERGINKENILFEAY